MVVSWKSYNEDESRHADGIEGEAAQIATDGAVQCYIAVQITNDASCRTATANAPSRTKPGEHRMEVDGQRGGYLRRMPYH